MIFGPFTYIIYREQVQSSCTFKSRSREGKDPRTQEVIDIKRDVRDRSPVAQSRWSPAVRPTDTEQKEATAEKEKET